MKTKPFSLIKLQTMYLICSYHKENESYFMSEYLKTNMRVTIDISFRFCIYNEHSHMRKLVTGDSYLNDAVVSLYRVVTRLTVFEKLSHGTNPFLSSVEPNRGIRLSHGQVYAHVVFCASVMTTYGLSPKFSRPEKNNWFPLFAVCSFLFLTRTFMTLV